ncbi:MAG: lysophospholipid acyltransferase family protein [Desulfomonilia bacterium]
MGKRGSLFSILQFHVVRAVIGLVRIMPYRTVLGIGRGLGCVGWMVDGFHRRVARIQMKAALGEAFRESFVKEVFKFHGDILIDTIRYAYMTDEEIRKRIIVEGKEHLDAAQATGRGLMIITGHIGNWEILSHLPRVIGIRFCVMADIRNDPRLESIIDDIRSRSGATILPPKGKALMLVKELKRGNIVGVLIDQRGKRSDRLLCTFFGLPAPTNPAPAFIAMKGDALVLTVHAIKEKDHYRVTFSPAMDSRTFGQPREAIQPLSDAMQAWVERVVREHACQWFWLHSRWTRRSDMREIIKTGADFRQYIHTQAGENS